MKNWMGVNNERLKEIFPGIMTVEGTTDGVVFQDLPGVQQTITGAEGFVS